MSDQEYIEATARKIAEMTKILDEAEAALDIEGRARAAGLDYQAVMASINAAAQKASPEAVAQAKRIQQEEEEQLKQERAKVISAMSRTATSAASPAPRRPRNMA